MRFDSSSAALNYEKPAISTILVLSLLLLALNIVNYGLDKLLYCGLLGQILIGVVFGTPGGKLLSESVEQAVVQLGYLGLILLVYEGGLSTSTSAIRANLFLSIAVALTGISLPIALSFILQPLANASPLQSFAAGAALCSTSLGTTFTILSASGLTETRLGTVLTSAAMMDDVVGLVMVQIISNLSSSGANISAVTVVRPLLVSFAFALITPLICIYVVKPLSRICLEYGKIKRQSGLHRALDWKHSAFILQTCVLAAFASGATYAGTSTLFAAYIAGAVITWWNDKLHQHSAAPGGSQTALQTQKRSLFNLVAYSTLRTRLNGLEVYHQYYSEPVNKVLIPFFFASIGFSIPISLMFSGPIIWRGIIYALLMTLAKLVCGTWLLRLQPITADRELSLRKRISLYPPCALGAAMVARGEIGFLISAVSQSRGIFAGQESDGDLFLIVTWAIFLCTFVGPLGVGVLVRRVRVLDNRGSSVLGSWGGAVPQ